MPPRMPARNARFAHHKGAAGFGRDGCPGLVHGRGHRHGLGHGPGSSKGFTLVEVLVVVFLTMILFGSSMLLFRGSAFHVQEGTEMLEAQAVLDRIERNLRQDIRCLRQVKSCSGPAFSFSAVLRGQPAVITYSWDATGKWLRRQQTGGPGAGERELGSPGVVEFCRFLVRERDGAFQRADVVLQVNTDRQHGPGAARLTVASQFASRCRESYKPWLH